MVFIGVLSLLVFLFNNNQLIEAQDCLVIEKRTSNKVSCKFPFIFNGSVFHECTNQFYPNEDPWCSTRVNPIDNNHVGGGGFWGYCNLDSSNCPIQNDEEVLQNRLLPTSTQSVECPCVALNECLSLKKLAQFASQFSKTHPRRIGIIQELKSMLCSNNTATKQMTFHCCNGNKKKEEEKEIVTTTATPLPDKDETTTIIAGSDDDDENVSKMSEKYNDSKLGTWRPSLKVCGDSRYSGSVLGGEITWPGEYPFAALLKYQIRNITRYGCGGTLINKFYVITAAHCINKAYSPVKEVVLGEYDVLTTKDCDDKNNCIPLVQRRKPAKIIVHPRWNINQALINGNDIGLIRLDRPIITFLDNPIESILMPVCLPWTTNQPKHNIHYNIKKGQKTTIIGWGKITNNHTITLNNHLKFNSAARILNKLNIRIQSREKCTQDFGQFNLRKMICSGGEIGKDSCDGDSGGPLLKSIVNEGIRKWLQIGIVSLGSNKCGIGKAGVYTRITAYMRWIESHLEP